MRRRRPEPVDGFLQVIAAGFGLLDRLAPLRRRPLTIREEGERLRKAFPRLDERRRPTHSGFPMDLHHSHFRVKLGLVPDGRGNAAT
jgi:hypothetical protein